MELSENYKKLHEIIKELYYLPENQDKLLFHGWHHIQFVHNKGIVFAEYLKCDVEKVAVAALVHDLNYMFTEKLEPEAANDKIVSYIVEAGYSEDYARTVIAVIESAHTAYRGERDLSDESKALSDADTLFKAIPTTPILFASKFITQNKFDIEKLAHKVVDEQKPLIEEGKYFYTKLAKEKYGEIAKITLKMWEKVLETLEDDDIKEVLETARDLGVI